MKTILNKTTITALVFTTVINLFSAEATNYKPYRGYKKSKKTIAFGLTGGINASTLAGDYLEEEKNGFLPGYNFGATCRYKLDKTFFLETQLLYTSKGSTVSSEYTYSINEGGLKSDILTKQDFKQTLNYIEIPLLAKYQNKNGFNVFAGPYVSFLTSARLTGTEYQKISTTIEIPFVGDVTEVNEDTYEVDERGTDALTKADIGFNAGLGFESRNGLGVGLKYGYGLTSIIQDEESKFNNSSLSLNLNYIF